MIVVLSKSVEEGMIDYFNSLSGYGISEERAQEKYLEMKHEVENAAQNPNLCQVCMYKVFGQTCKKNGDPKKLNLRKFTYTDSQSGSKWIFSFLVDEKQHKVIVHKMLHSSKVINEEKGETTIRRVTKSEFRQIVKEEVVKLLSKFIK